MLGELLEKLIEIENEKRSKLKPENIKAGVTILGVTGTYEGSGSEGGDS